MLKFQNKKLNIKYVTQKNYFFMLTFFVLSQTGLIKLVWDVVGEDLAKLLGYKFPKALQACLEGNDHHKAFQFCEILLFVTGYLASTY